MAISVTTRQNRKARLTIDGQVIDIMLMSIETQAPPCLSYPEGRVYRANEPTIVKITGYVVPSEHIRLPVVKQDRFTLAKFIEHEEECSCKSCFQTRFEEADTQWS